MDTQPISTKMIPVHASDLQGDLSIHYIFVDRNQMRGHKKVLVARYYSITKDQARLFIADMIKDNPELPQEHFDCVWQVTERLHQN